MLIPDLNSIVPPKVISLKANAKCPYSPGCYDLSFLVPTCRWTTMSLLCTWLLKRVIWTCSSSWSPRLGVRSTSAPRMAWPPCMQPARWVAYLASNGWLVTHVLNSFSFFPFIKRESIHCILHFIRNYASNLI